MKILNALMFLLWASAALAEAPSSTAVPVFVQAAISSSDRPAADVERDALRKPAALLVFAGIKPGDRVLELVPGSGYFTRLFSNVVANEGEVDTVVPAELMQAAPKSADDVRAMAALPEFANVRLAIQPTASLSVKKPVDYAWTSDNYHDVYGFFGENKALAMDRAVLKALRPGGIFIVIDHVAMPGTSAVSPSKLHRIDPATVKAQVIKAGFEFVAESDALANPDDPHDIIVFTPSIRGKTDQFVFKFRKPS